MSESLRIRKRILAYAIGLALIISQFAIIPQGVAYGLSEDQEPNGGSSIEAAAAADGSTVLAFTSDVHNKSENESAIRLNGWIDKVEEVYGPIEVMSFCGDMGNANVSEDNFWTYTEKAMAVVSNKMDAIYTTGNHEYSNGNFSKNLNSTTLKYKVGEEGRSEDNYCIYCLGSPKPQNRDEQKYYSDQIELLTSYLESVPNGVPVIIITHFPLHIFGSRTTTLAKEVIDALNAEAEKGKKIVFLWGHNHSQNKSESNKDAYYDTIRIPGDTIQYANNSQETIQFYYAAAGCMSDSEYQGSKYVLGKGLIITINSKKQLSFNYYDIDGNVLKGSKASYTEKEPVSVSNVMISPGSKTLEAGTTVQLNVTVEPEEADNPSVIWSSSDSTVAKVDNSGLVTAVSPGEAVITVKSQENEDISASCTVTVIKSQEMEKEDAQKDAYDALQKALSNLTTEEMLLYYSEVYSLVNEFIEKVGAAVSKEDVESLMKVFETKLDEVLHPSGGESGNSGENNNNNENSENEALKAKVSSTKVTIKSVKVGKKKLTVSWKPNASLFDGYEIKYRIKGKSWKTVTVSGPNAKSKVIKKLKKGKKYQVKIRGFKKIGSETVTGKYSKTLTSKKVK
jgi:uncharacterized protein YjdB